MNVLLATNHLEAYAGSEMVCLEIAEHYVAGGNQCTVFVNRCGSPMQDEFEAIGVKVETDPARIRPFHYDLAYFQHHVAPLFIYDESPENRPATCFVFAHLSTVSDLAGVGVVFEDVLADFVFVNSLATASRIAEFGIDEARIAVFENAAPDAYFAPRPAFPERPSHALLISNHAPEEVLGCMSLLQDSLSCEHIGRGGTPRRITPEIIRGPDLVITIGKTVQYCLAARTPVYVYDHFGGPGYLNAGNFSAAAQFHFCGKCCGRRLTAEDMRTEILQGYRQACDYQSSLDERAMERFRLALHLERLSPAVSNAQKLARLEEHRHLAERDRIFAQLVRRLTGRRQRRV